MSAGASQTDRRNLILRCRDGDEAALGTLLDEYRDWLKNVAAKELDGRASSRIDASDVVQQTLLSAVKDIGQFEGSTSAELRVWLGQIHKCNIRDALRRHVVAGKRSTNAEQSLTPHALPDQHGSTPSQRIIRQERRQRVREHLDSLPDDQATAVRLRHLEGWSLAQLAEHFGRSEDSVASLLKRGLENLRRRVRDD